MRRGFAFPIRGIFLALLAVTGIFMVSNSAEAVPWVSLYNTQLSSHGAGAFANRTQQTTLPPPPTGAGYYFNTVLHTTPSDFTIYAGADVLDGTWVATNKSFIRAGFVNGPCATTIPVPLSGDFQLVDATTDDSVLISHADGAQDADSNGIRDGAERYPIAVDSLYPQGDVGVPRSRAYGFTFLLGSPVAVHFLTYDPGTFAGQGVPASLGYVTASFAVTGDPGFPTAGAVSDACTTFLSTNTHFGISRDNINTVSVDESGIELSRNPTTQGSYSLGNYVLPVRDTDDDGVENSLDTCPYITNIDGSERTSKGPDNDSIDSACDPQTGINNGDDADGDGFNNRLDNCPLIANANQLETESTNPGAFGSDLGSKTDSIGDACDVTPALPDGHYHTTASGPPGATSGPQCLVDVTCGHVCTTYAFGSPPAGCTTFNPAGCTGTTGTPCTPPASPPVTFTTQTIGPLHDVATRKVNGSQKVNGGPHTRQFSVQVSNPGSVTEDIQVALKADAVTADCTVNGGAASQTQTGVATGVLPGTNASVVFSVTFDGCTGANAGTSTDYVVTADACHQGDPAPAGFFGSGACPGTNDGDTDGDPRNDAPRTRAINDTTR